MPQALAVAGPQPDTAALLLTIPQVAQRLSVGTTTVYELLRRGELRSVRVGRCRRVPAEALREYVGRLSAEAAQ